MTDTNEISSEANGAKMNDPAAGHGGGGGDGTNVPLVFAEPKDRAPEEVQSNPLGLLFIAGLFALLWFRAGPRYFWVVVGLMVMIFLHELGHYLTARWTGMKATQFFLFMGPRLWSFHRGETEYGIRLLPIGAFVRIIGMHNLDPVPPEDEHRAYQNKSYPRRMLVITAGSIMHFIQAIILFLVVTSVIGLDDPEKWSVGEISALETGETPSVTAELLPGDTITAVDGVISTDWRDLREYIRDNPGETVDLTVVRGEETFQRSTTLATLEDANGGDDFGFLGVAPSFEHTRQSPMMAVDLFGETFWQALTSIPRFLSPSTFANLGTSVLSGSGEVDINSEEAERPISVVGAVRIAGSPDFDVTWPISLLAILNIFIGILNLLPLLPLDGGHAAIATYERLRSRKDKPYHVDVAKLLPLTYGVVALLAFIMLSTVYLDIFRPIVQ
jgi:membrane-associated protease RseP (regulator of RpoE activity)